MMPEKNSDDPEHQQLLASYSAAGQAHVFHFYDKLDAGQRAQLLGQLRDIDPARVVSIFGKATAEAEARAAAEAAGRSAAVMEPLPAECFDSVETCQPGQLHNWRQAGLSAVAGGKLAILLLAGGQGTRLGSAAPKGCYNIGLPSGKSLFQLQAERIRRLQTLATTAGSGGAVVPWYVMTSGPTRAATEDFFCQNKYFGLDAANVVFFDQGVLPAFTADGKIIMESAGSVSVAPDGNGGVYAGLRNHHILQDMERRGVQYVHAYCVDNCLVRVGDPVFVGYCIGRGAQCGAKVVRKTDPAEPVGVVCRVDGKFGVVEYSEISKADSERRDASGKLAFDAANIVNHFYTVAFLKKACSREFEANLGYHIAHKKIKHIDLATGEVVTPSKPNGIKLELFIFDIFPFLSTAATATQSDFAVLSVPRVEEFSPLKNAPGATADCPETSRRDIYRQSARYLTDAGAKLADAATENILNEAVPVVECSPLLTYDGEGLADVVKGKTVKLAGGKAYIADVAALKSMLA